MVDVFTECKRVLKDDGTLWLNIGDSYAGSGQAAQMRTVNRELIKEQYLRYKVENLWFKAKRLNRYSLDARLCAAFFRLVFKTGYYLAQTKPNARKRYRQMHKST
jgi:DNA modification methylase